MAAALLQVLPTSLTGRSFQEISQDEREKARARSRKMYEMDQYSNLHTAILRGELQEREKWQGVVADKEAEIETLRLRISELEAKIKT